MTESNNEGAKNQSGAEGGAERSAADNVREAFGALPLPQKVSTLINVELDMLGDAVGGVVSVVSRAVDDFARACETSEQSGPATSGAADQTSTSR